MIALVATGMSLLKKASLAAVLLVSCRSLSAQWLHYPTPGIPRNPDGSPNLAVPAPKTADGKPDFSGLWNTERNRPCPPDGCPDQEVSQEFLNFGWGLKGGLPYQPWAAELVKARMVQNGKDDPGTKCLPIGFVRVLSTDAMYRKIVQIPGLLVILHERDTAYRQIFTDGRPLPVDPNPSWNGYSIGKWDGDVLAIETIGFRDGEWLDRNGSPLTDRAKVTERIRRVNFGHMQVEVTVDDPKAYTKPWTVKLNLVLVPDSDLVDYTCLENEKDAGHLVGK
jgi:hypothetical protein